MCHQEREEKEYGRRRSVCCQSSYLGDNVTPPRVGEYMVNVALWCEGNSGASQHGQQQEQPNHQRWHAKGKRSQNMCTLRACFCMLGHRFAMLSRCLVKKISASELRRKFIKNAMLVGEENEVLFQGFPPNVSELLRWENGRESLCFKILLQFFSSFFFSSHCKSTKLFLSLTFSC